MCQRLVHLVRLIVGTRKKRRRNMKMVLVIFDNSISLRSALYIINDEYGKSVEGLKFKFLDNFVQIEVLLEEK